MDRWDGADDDTELINKKRHQQGQGRTDNRFMSSSAAAAAGAPGLGGFVRSCTNEVSNDANGQKTFAIEIVASKKEQIQERKRSADAAAMPPPPPRRPMAAGPSLDSSSQAPAAPVDPSLGVSPQPGSHALKAPSWATVPVPGASLLVFKGPDNVQTILLNKVQIVFGRHASADVPCDHPSLSRLHAAFLGKGNDVVVMDLGSTHGTFVDGLRLAQNEHVTLREGSTVTFAASTRKYIFVIEES